jgi:hypothetical protein
MDLEIAFLDGRIRPHPRHQLVLADQFAGMLDEHDEDLQGPAADTECLPAFEQQTPIWMEVKRSE